MSGIYQNLRKSWFYLGTAVNFKKIYVTSMRPLSPPCNFCFPKMIKMSFFLRFLYIPMQKLFWSDREKIDLRKQWRSPILRWISNYSSRKLSAAHFVRRIMWTPESVDTGSLSSLTSSANAASSKGFCILPRPKLPRSPPCFAELQSLNSAASSSNVFSLATMDFRNSEGERNICKSR